MVKKRSMSFISDFKAFAMRGNVIDLAVGVIIGGAFNTIVSSLVADVIMPPIGLLIGGVDFTSLAITLKPAVDETPAVVIHYGNFIQAIINFLIIAFAIFIFIRLLSKLEKKKTEAPAPIPPTKDQQLLMEIRDLLKSNAQNPALAGDAGSAVKDGGGSADAGAKAAENAGHGQP